MRSNFAGQRTGMTDGLGSTAWTYGTNGRLLSVTDPFNKTVTYIYDTKGSRTGLIYPDGKQAAYTYDSDGSLAAVGSYPAGASPYGAMDMAGNVCEWVADWWSLDNYDGSPYSNPTGPDTGENKVYRGGSWYDFDDDVRVTGRTPSGPEYNNNYIGFRCVSPAE